MASEDEIDIPYQTATVETEDSDIVNLSIVFRAKKTQIQMLRDRGYEIDEVDEEIVNLTDHDEFWNYVNEKVPKISTDPTAFWDFLTKTYVYNIDGVHKENLVIFLPPPISKSFPASKLNKYIEIVKRNPTIGYIDIIYENPLTKTTRTKLLLTNRNVTSWMLKDLTFSIVDSYYVGNKKENKILGDAEYRELYAGSGIFKGQLPHYRRDDPQTKYWQWTPGMVIENLETGDLNVAVSKVLKHYIVTPESIAELVDTVDTI